MWVWTLLAAVPIGLLVRASLRKAARERRADPSAHRGSPGGPWEGGYSAMPRDTSGGGGFDSGGAGSSGF